MPPAKAPSLTYLTRNLLKHRYLLAQLVKREVLLRYRGAYFGLLWIFLHPLIMLAIFAFVFGQIFQPRWTIQASGVPHALNLYCGLIAFNIFGDTVSRSPNAVRSHPSYVKKIIFPVHILPIVPLGAALVHASFNLLILIGALAWVDQLRVSQFLIPLLLAPLLLFSLGLAWFVSAWGVFLKDMTQIVPVFVQISLFLSPVFYPADALPSALQPLFRHNPLGAVIENLRAALAGAPLDWPTWAIALLISFATALLAGLFFHHSRDEFADAI